MNGTPAQRIDWRDAQAYGPLLEAERHVFAWEWLRRDRAYAAAYAGVRGRNEARTARDWALHSFEDPDLPAVLARPLWRSEAYASVLRAAVLPGGEHRDCFDLRRFARLARVEQGDGIEHVLLSTGVRALRLDILKGSVRNGPVRLGYALHGLASVRSPLVVLHQLLALVANGRLTRTAHPPWARARRQVLLLRAFDALRAGASQRDIAAALLSAEADLPCWRAGSPSLRSRVQRLVRGARAMPANYRLFLG